MYAVSYHWASECRGCPSKDEPAYPNAFDHCDMYMNIHFSLAFQHIFKNHIFFLNSLCIKEHFHWSSCKWSQGTLWCAIILYLLLSCWARLSKCLLTHALQRYLPNGNSFHLQVLIGIWTVVWLKKVNI